MTGDERFEKRRRWRRRTLVSASAAVELWQDAHNYEDLDDDHMTSLLTPPSYTIQNRNRALLRLFDESGMTDEKALPLVAKLLLQGARVTARDEETRRTPLHQAVYRNWPNVCLRILEAGANANARDKFDLSPFRLALDSRNDDIAAMLIAYMPNEIARDLYTGGEIPAECSFHQLFELNMKKTIWSLLDCLLDSCNTYDGRQRIWYTVLEVDDQGRTPDNALYNAKTKSVFQIMIEGKRQEFLQHDVIRLLVEKRWAEVARKIYICHAVFYLAAVIGLTYSAVLACEVTDPAIYDTPLDYSRAAAEIIAYGVVLARLFIEIRQIYNRRSSYFKDPFSLINMCAVLVLLTVIPLRFTHRREQWAVFAVGYFLWYIRMFHYAVLFRHLGIYIQILWQIICRDVLHFAAVYTVVLFGFSGALLLSTKWDEPASHQSNSTFPEVIFTMARTLFETQPAAAYTGEYGYGSLGTFLMCLYLFTCIVVFVNMLIAQITATFQHKRNNAERERYLNLAWMITRVELTSPFLPKEYRKKCYTPCENVDLKTALGTWNQKHPDVTQRRLKEMQETIDVLDSRMRTLDAEQRKTNKTLKGIRGQLTQIVEHIQAPRPT